MITSSVIAVLQDQHQSIPWWIPILLTLLGGGAAGAIITALVTRYRNRRQPVFYTLEIIQVFDKNKVYGSVKATIGIENAARSGVDLELENFTVALLTIVNKGNQDVDEFPFGITLEKDTQAFDVTSTTPDRHHVVTCQTAPTATDFRKELDFTLAPFNREDSYSFALYLTYFDSLGEIRVGSVHPARFVKRLTLHEPEAQKKILRFTKWVLVLLAIQILWNLLSLFKILPPFLW